MMPPKAKVIQRECIVCGRDFDVYTRKNRGRGVRSKPVRGFNMRTCSRRCAKDYVKIKQSYREKLIEKWNKKHKK